MTVPRWISKTTTFISRSWRSVVVISGMIAIGGVASYGVYRFSRHFVPFPVASMQGVSLELVYCGLALLQRMSPQHRQRAIRISMSAVSVSVIYNFLDRLLYLRPSLMIDRPFWWDAVLAFVEGFPFAVLAFLVANLILHRGEDELKQEIEQTFLEHAVVTNDQPSPEPDVQPKTVPFHMVDTVRMPAPPVPFRPIVIAQDQNQDQDQRSDRDQQIMMLKLTGMGYREIAQRVGVSRTTVCNVVNKYKQNGQTEAA